MDSSVKSERNPYEVLGLTPGATDEEVRAAYFRLIRPYREHPHETDARAVRAAREISLAFQTLREAAKRRAYDTSAVLSKRSNAIETREQTACGSQPFIAKTAPRDLRMPNGSSRLQRAVRLGTAPSQIPETSVGQFIAATLRATPAELAPTPSEHSPATDDSADAESPPCRNLLDVEEPPEAEAGVPIAYSSYRLHAIALAAVPALALGVVGLWAISPDVATAPGSDKPSATRSMSSIRGPGLSFESFQPAQPLPKAGADTSSSKALEVTSSSRRSAEASDIAPSAGAGTSQPAEVPPSAEPEGAAPATASGTVGIPAPEGQPTQADSAPPPPEPQQAAPIPPPMASRMAPAALIGGGLYDSDNPGGMLQGTVNVRFTVTSDGRATGCRPTASSGNPGLDGHTCQLVEQRLRFRPALDVEGRPTTSEANATYTWLRKPRPRSTPILDWIRGRP